MLQHIAIIMDGNGRWAEGRGKSRLEGHEAGARNVKVITEACQELGVRVLTLYAFSTENWRRSKQEIDSLSANGPLSEAVFRAASQNKRPPAAHGRKRRTAR